MDKDASGELELSEFLEFVKNEFDFMTDEEYEAFQRRTVLAHLNAGHL